MAVEPQSEKYSSEELDRLLVTGRTFGLVGRIHKGVVIGRNDREVIWMFGYDETPGSHTADEFTNYLNWLGPIDEDYLKSCKKPEASQKTKSDSE